MKITNLVLSLILGVALVQTGCKSETEKEKPPEAPPKVDRANPNEKTVDPHAGHNHGPDGEEIVEPKTKSAFAFQLPEGWVDKGAKPMRDVNLAVPGDPETQCYVSILKGTAGGEAANFNRWRNQMGQEMLSEEQLSGLQSVDVLGGKGKMVEIEGSFSGMGGANIKEAKMIGVILARSDSSVFIKFLGPKATVDKEKGNFLIFCASLKPGN